MENNTYERNWRNADRSVCSSLLGPKISIRRAASVLSRPSSLHLKIATTPRTTQASGKGEGETRESQQSVSERGRVIPRGGWRRKKTRVGGKIIRHRIEGDREATRWREGCVGLSRDGRAERIRAGAEERRARFSNEEKNIARNEDSLQEDKDIGKLDDLEVDLLLVVEIFRFL